MTNEEKVKELAIRYTQYDSDEDVNIVDAFGALREMAKWKDQQFKEYLEKAKTFLLGKFTKMEQTELATYCALGLNEEAGEVAGKIKKAIRDSDGKIDTERTQAIAFEMGDVIWYLAILADTLGISLDSVMEMNIKKLESRKERGVICGQGDNR